MINGRVIFFRGKKVPAVYTEKEIMESNLACEINSSFWKPIIWGLSKMRLLITALWCIAHAWPRRPHTAHCLGNSSPPALKVKLYRPLTLDCACNISAKMKQNLLGFSSTKTYYSEEDWKTAGMALFLPRSGDIFVNLFFAGVFKRRCYGIFLLHWFSVIFTLVPATVPSLLLPRGQQSLPPSQYASFISRKGPLLASFYHLISILGVSQHHPVTFRFSSGLLSRLSPLPVPLCVSLPHDPRRRPLVVPAWWTTTLMRVCGRWARGAVVLQPDLISWLLERLVMLPGTLHSVGII